MRFNRLNSRVIVRDSEGHWHKIPRCLARDILGPKDQPVLKHSTCRGVVFDLPKQP